MIDPNGPGIDAPPTRDQPWLMRTYAGHSSARESNALFRRNLAKGERAQTGLSVAFDLPTQTGYDADHVLARGEVGVVAGLGGQVERHRQAGLGPVTLGQVPPE